MIPNAERLSMDEREAMLLFHFGASRRRASFIPSSDESGMSTLAPLAFQFENTARKEFVAENILRKKRRSTKVERLRAPLQVERFSVLTS
jgi:hypothetical protein